MRVYAATIPVQAVIVGLGASTLLGLTPLKRFKFAFEKPSNIVPIKVPMVGGLLLVGICFMGPILLSLRSDQWSKVVQYDQAYCSKDSELLFTRFSSGSSFNLVEGERISNPIDLNTSLNAFKNGLGGLSLYPELIDELKGLQEGQTLTFAINLNRITEDIDDSHFWLVTDSERLANLPPGIMQICARPTTNAWVSRYNFYYVDSIETVEN